MSADMERSPFTLHDLERTIAARADMADGSSYTAQLVRGGAKRTAKKLGEEATEVVIASLGEDDAALRGEAADLLYHLLVLLHVRGVALDTVLEELGRRTAESGLAEKQRRAPADKAD